MSSLSWFCKSFRCLPVSQQFVRVVIILLCLFSFRSSQAEIPPEQQNRILILNSYHPYYSWSDHEMEGIIETLRKLNPDIEPFVEYMNCKIFPNMDHFSHLRDMYRHNFRNINIPLVIVADNPALQFAQTYRRELFPKAAIVFCGINGYSPEMLRGQQNITGVAEILDAGKTVETMLQLHPGTREIFVIHDYTTTGLATRRESQAQLAALEGRVRIRYMEELTTDQMLAKVRKLPKDALILALSYSRDKEGRVFDHRQIAKLLSENSPVPVYSVHEERLGYGIVGGSLLGGKLHGARAAEIALDILGGKNASAIPVETRSTARLMFDFQQLQRFNIALDKLPSGSIVINRPVTFYQKYTLLVWSAVGVIAGLVAIILLLYNTATVRKHAAKAMAEKAGELEQRVMERTADLEEVNTFLKKEIEHKAEVQEEVSCLNEDLLQQRAALEVANRELESFGFSVSHDLQTPLRHISGYTEILLQDYADKLDGTARHYLQRVNGASRNMSDLIDALLYLSRTSRGPLNLTTIDLSAVAREIAASLQESAPARLVSFAIADTGEVEADATLMHAVIENLFSNAWKYTRQKEGAIISFGSIQQDGTAEYFVSDNGVGFDLQNADKLFGAFQRFHKAEEYEGTGIGLATVQRIIQRHGGKIRAEAEVGKGATFYFNLQGNNAIRL